MACATWFASASTAHELGHLLIKPVRAGVWDPGEHLIGNPGGTALMGDASVVGNNQEATVVVTGTTMLELDVSGNPTLR